MIGAFASDPTASRSDSTTSRQFSLNASVEIREMEKDMVELKGLLGQLSSSNVKLKLRLLLPTYATRIETDEAHRDEVLHHLRDICTKLRALGSPPPHVFEAAHPYGNLLKNSVLAGQLAQCHELLNVGISLEMISYYNDTQKKQQASKDAKDKGKNRNTPTLNFDTNTLLQYVIKAVLEQKDGAKDRQTIRSLLHAIFASPVKPHDMEQGVCVALFKNEGWETSCKITSDMQLDSDMHPLRVLFEPPILDPNTQIYDPNPENKVTLENETGSGTEVCGQDQNGTPLQDPRKRKMPLVHAALKWEQTDAMKYLIGAKANVNALDWKGRPLLHMLAKKKAGAQDLIKEMYSGHQEEFTLQLKHRSGKQKSTPLHMACRGGSVEAVELLIEKKAQLEVCAFTLYCHRNTTALIIVQSSNLAAQQGCNM